MRNSISISLLFLLLISCKVQSPKVAYTIPKPFIVEAGKSLVYRASFNYKDYHFSGLCVFKKIEERNIRVVFLNEMGMTFMDFELTPSDLIVHKMVDQLNRGILLGFIENDFRQLLMTDLFDPMRVNFKKMEKSNTFQARDKLRTTYFIEKEGGKIARSVRKGFLGAKKSSVSYEYRLSNIPEEIMLKHYQVKMNLKLTLLEKI